MKQIVNILFCISLLLFPATGFAQTILPEDLSLINLQVMKPSGLEKQDGAASLLEERLIQGIDTQWYSLYGQSFSINDPYT